MGKYMKKSRTSGDVATSSLGVRTRANRLRPPSSPSQNLDSSAYLQLRSRRLLKLQPPPPPQRKERSVEVENSRLKENSEKIASLLSVSGSRKLEAEEKSVDLGMEGSFGENFFEVEAIDRNSRESTPCSLIKDSNSITTIPGSSTRQRTHQRKNHENLQRKFPSDHEIDEFFAHGERQQQAMFIEKYNFDIINDVPLHGQYIWVKVLNN